MAAAKRVELLLYQLFFSAPPLRSRDKKTQRPFVFFCPYRIAASLQDVESSP